MRKPVRAETTRDAQTEQRTTTTTTTTTQRQSYRDGRASGAATQRWDRSQTVTAQPAQTQRFDTSSRDRANRDWQRDDNNRSYRQSYDRRSANNPSYRRNDSYRASATSARVTTSM